MQKYSEFIEKIEEKHTIIKFTEGKKILRGRTAGEIKNPYWLVKNDETNEEYYIMVCGENVFTYISKEDIKQVTEHKYTWTYNKTIHYVQSNTNTKEGSSYLHAFITGHMGHGQGGDSVDHINRKRLDNRRENLRVVTVSENTANCGKRKRKIDARPLPEELGDRQLPKYVEYCHEDKNYKDLLKDFGYDEIDEDEKDELKDLKMLKRDFFVVVDHPCQEPDLKGRRLWTTTKSIYVSIVEKYNMITDFIESLGYDWKLDLISDKDLHSEFFTNMSEDSENSDDDLDDIEDDFIEKKEKKTIKRINTPSNKIIEILLWKEKLIKKEKMEDGTKITRNKVCDYFNEKDNSTFTFNVIHRFWNIKVLKEDEFIDNKLGISYEKYIELISTPAR